MHIIRLMNVVLFYYRTKAVTKHFWKNHLKKLKNEELKTEKQKIKAQK